MSEFRPTAAQKAAIESRGSTILVSAGAGSGKTKVLTERLMSYIKDEENPADLDSFLIITFTKAAAGELRGRIMDELAAALAEDPGNRHLRRQSALCSRAQIGTIHSFCARLLRENSQLASLPPDFKIMDEDRASSMKKAALDRVLEKHYDNEEKYPGFRLLCDTVGAGRDDGKLAEAVLSLSEKMQSHARPARWAEKQTELLDSGAEDAGDTPWGREILDGALRSARFWSVEFRQLLDDMSQEDKINNAYSGSFSVTAEQMERLCGALEQGWDQARECLPIEFPRLGTLRNSPDRELSERLKERRALCRKSMDSIGRKLSADSAGLMRDMALTAPSMKALLELCLDCDREFSADKRRAGFVDYNDLEHIAAELLTDDEGRTTALAQQVAQRYTEIMVDEYQDVSRVQDAIFRAVSKDGRNLFLVGDVKQSIYRFRLADPEIFTEKYLSFPDAADAGEGEERRIMLQENFRSRKEILDGANSVFSLCMSRALGDIDYDENAELKYGGSYENSVPVPEIMLLQLPEDDGGGENPDRTVLEARLVGQKIQRLMAEGTTVSGRDGERPLEYGDIALLLRAANSNGAVYRRELMAMGIPVGAGTGGGFFTSVEVSTVISMLAVIDNPHQDIALIAALRSPAFGFTADELSDMRAEDKKSCLCEALKKHAERDVKSRSFIEKLEYFRELAPDISAAELLWEVMEKLDMLALCSAMTDGERRRGRLMELLELSEKFESSGYRGLHRFVLWLREMSEQGREPAAGPEGGSAVQIMSVHKSKGLEFPVVFLSDTARRFNKMDSRETVLIHPVLGLGPKLTDLQKRVSYPTLARNAIQQRLDRETLSEELRLMYVALTRAKERLFITAAMKKPEEELEKAAYAVSDPMAPEILAQAAAPVNWLIYSALADGEKHLKLSICPCSTEKENSAEKAAAPEPDCGILEELRKRLSFRYPYSAVEELPSKLTATELKGRMENDEDAESIAPRRRHSFPMPDFTKKDKPLTGAERGIATHLMLQYMDFSKSGSTESIKEELARLKNAGFLSQREAEAVNVDAVRKLFSSELGRRMLKAEKIKREFKFSVLWDGAELFPEAEGESLLMQGVVDCFIEEEGELVVIDYKTDRIGSGRELHEKAEFYSGQMEVYARSLARICSRPVKECILYFLSAGKAVSLKF